MYGMGDAIRGYQDDVMERDRYIGTLEDMIGWVLEWYANIEEPGNIPNHNEIHHTCRLLKKVIEMKGWK
jgi:hypothetical protein